jgi:palmitoyl-protein thioesterase
MINMTDQTVYKNDVFGLKTLNDNGKLIVHDVPNVQHMDWIIKPELFTQFIEPHLD